MTPRAFGIGAFGVAALGALGYAVGIEPFWIESVHYELSIPRLPEAFDGYTVTQISDLHTSSDGLRERRLAAIMAKLPPADLITITGDLIHTPRGTEPFLKLAASFRSRDGIYAIFGNSEHKNGVRPHAFARILSENGITPLLNSHILLERDGAQIALAGVDDPVSNKDDLSQALSGIPEDIFVLLMMHSPHAIAEAVVRGVDVVLSGHTHGGQVKLPWFGALYTHNPLGRRMSDGYYAGKRLRNIIGIRPGRTQLYVTRGLGVSGLALRFLCRPEFTRLTLRRGNPGITLIP